jgi:hypothetical protein
MDRPYPLDPPSFRRSSSKNNSSESSGNTSPDFTKNTVSCTTDSKTMILSDHNDVESRTTSPLSLCFRNSCQINQDSDSLRKNDNCETDPCSQCFGNQEKDNAKASVSCSTHTLERTTSEKFKSASADNKSTDSDSSLDELG